MKKITLGFSLILIISYFLFYTKPVNDIETSTVPNKNKTSSAIITKAAKSQESNKAKESADIGDIQNYIESGDLSGLRKSLKNGFDPNTVFNNREFSILMDLSKNCN